MFSLLKSPFRSSSGKKDKPPDNLCSNVTPITPGTDSFRVFRNETEGNPSTTIVVENQALVAGHTKTIGVEGVKEDDQTSDSDMDVDDEFASVLSQPLDIEAVDSDQSDAKHHEHGNENIAEANQQESLQDGPVDSHASPALDIIDRLPGLYRILDLVKERGSGGLVDKIIISQESYGQFINEIQPGAYTSITHCDFNALDKVSLKVVGVYGIKREIVAYLQRINAIDDTITLTMIRSTDEDFVTKRRPYLSSGLYAAIQRSTVAGDIVHVFYWPEDNTWNDNAPSDTRRNRVTFIRYLTKVADQVVALISPTEARKLVWTTNEDENEGSDEEDTSDRLFSFEVSKSKEQDEDVSVRRGFTLRLPPLPPLDYAMHKHSAEVVIPRPFLAIGETVMGYVSVQFVDGEKTNSPLNGIWYSSNLKAFIASKSLYLPQSLDEDSLQILLTYGLDKRMPGPFAELSTRRKAATQTAADNMERELSQLQAEFEVRRPTLLSAVRGAFYDHLLGFNLDQSELAKAFLCDFVATQKSVIEDAKTGTEPSKEVNVESELADSRTFLANLATIHPSVREEIDSALHFPTRVLFTPEFRKLKERILCLHSLLMRHPDVRGEQLAGILRSAFQQLDKPFDMKKIFSSVSTAGNESSKGFFSSITSFFSGDNFEAELKEIKSRASHTDDFTFLKQISNLRDDLPELAEYTSAAVLSATNTFIEKSLKRVNILVERIGFLQMHDCSKQMDYREKIDRDNVFGSSRASFLEAAQTCLILPDSRETYRVTGVEKCRQSADSFNVHGTVETFTERHFRYCVDTFDLSQSDRHKLQSDPLSVPSPIVTPSSSFELPVTYGVVHFQLLEGGKCLLLTRSHSGWTEVYLEDLHSIGRALERHANKKRLHEDKLGPGEQFTFAYDEVKRLLAVCTSDRLHIFMFDERYMSLSALGSAIDLRHWYGDQPVHIRRAAFVGQRDEIALLDHNNRVRVFSLITQQFRPGFVQLERSPDIIFATPDGSCLCSIERQDDNTLSLRSFHWSNFGSTPGITNIFDAAVGTEFCMTSFVNRSTVHLVGFCYSTLICKSVTLDITKKVTEFSFQAKGAKVIDVEKTQTAHNSLLDCHSDVWTKFPVVAAIRRQMTPTNRRPKALTFLTDRDHSMFPGYFKNLISRFQRTTRKPTEGELDSMHIQATSFDAYFCSTWDLSDFRAGEWIMNMTCLIPIHIAVARDNRFVPFKDGVWSIDLERRLLGAKVEQIVDDISFGWYESIFQSYMPNKPVKVVSSMGEQSVGKSYALNHLADTTFAGSAMRTTEGVWMSVTPTDGALIVALDFEGVHSIERSAQEDTLLVLFNTALSNLVLFRNNFALSRDIASLFQSFQSSSTILDPEADL